jgi:glutamyl-Q tRNA(Asp) synthetase
MPFPIEYRGRFAPSPTGPLHFGSLVAAVGSYLDAKHVQGKWLVRIEDLDTPRTVKGASDDILNTLEAFGLHWDEPVIYQSQRTVGYEQAFDQLLSLRAVYPCACTRKEIADSALHGIEGQIYPGTCRSGIKNGREGRSWRVRTDCLRSLALPYFDSIKFCDVVQGIISQQLENELGDFVVKRADGLFSYQLAVVVDDAFQGITHIVRGADLLSSTPRQIYLQKLLGLATPTYLHLPVALNSQGEKLSKQTLAAAVDCKDVSRTLCDVLKFLHQPVPDKLQSGTREEILMWSLENWNVATLKNN